MRARLWLPLLAVALLLGSVAAARASGWTPVAPPGQPVLTYAPLRADDPRSWQTLAEAPFELAGGAFHAEVRGFAQLSSNAVHAFHLRVVRTGGEDVRLVVTPAPNGDVSAFRRASLVEGAWEVPFEMTGFYDNASLAAEADVAAYRPASFGFVESGEHRVRLPFTFDVVHAPEPPPSGWRRGEGT